MSPTRSRTQSRAPAVPEALAQGRTSYQRREWKIAFQLLAGADRAQPLGAEDLERLAWSAALSGQDAEMVKALERAHQLHVDAGQPLRAATAAFWAGFRLMFLGETGRGSAWLTRAERLVDQQGCDCVEQGYLLLPVIQRHLMQGDTPAALEAATRAVEIARRFADPDLDALARNLQGMIEVGRGRLAEGLALLDEVMLAAIGGELSPVVTGIVYCSVIACCMRVYALDRAREWTAALAAWCDAQPHLVSFSGTCRVHRSEIMEIHGAWSEAIEEARRAGERFAGAVDADAGGHAVYQQGEIHRLRGEYAAAEQAYRLASQQGREPQPGLALLRLAQGQGEAAATSLRRALETAREPLQRARFLPALVEVLLAVGDREGAAESARELEEIAARFPVECLQAIAEHAQGALRLATGDARGALLPLRHAFEVWRQNGAPYLAARVRVLVGMACRVLGDREGADLEFEAAQSVFESLGALPDLERLAVRRDDVEGVDARPHGLTARELEVLRLVATGKTNKAIATDLFLSEKTVDRHVSNIFMKLDVSTRTAATAYAWKSGIAGERRPGR
jgi:DNA-binding CsgD family transcriptional regulator